jgi:hypothetical protein
MKLLNKELVERAPGYWELVEDGFRFCVRRAEDSFKASVRRETPFTVLLSAWGKTPEVAVGNLEAQALEMITYAGTLKKWMHGQST